MRGGVGIIEDNSEQQNTLKEKELLDLNKSLEGMLKILQRLIGEDIELSWRPSQEQAVRAQGTILVAEDEPTILEMVKEMLEELGYQVLPASTLAEAIRIAEKYTHSIDLLITGVVMPEMNGRLLNLSYFLFPTDNNEDIPVLENEVRLGDHREVV